MEQKEKIIIVGMHIGRMGSSAMMGLLRIAGVNVGHEDRLSPPKPMNPKGFLELLSLNPFLKRVYGDLFSGLSKPPSLDVLRDAGPRHYREYLELLRTEFGQEFPIAIKAPRLLTLPFLHEFREEFDIRILKMERNLEDHVASIVRVWRDSDDPRFVFATRKDITKYVESWRQFTEEVLAHYDFRCLHVSFDEILREPVSSMQDIARFLEIPCSAPAEIADWLDPSIVNRKTVPGSILEKPLKDRLLFKATMFYSLHQSRMLFRLMHWLIRSYRKGIRGNKTWRFW